MRFSKNSIQAVKLIPNTIFEWLKKSSDHKISVT
jgi:hypothetical protein